MPPKANLARTGFSGGCVYDKDRDEWRTAAILQLNRESACGRCGRLLALNAFVTRVNINVEHRYVCDTCRPWHLRPGYWNRTTDYIGPLPWLNCPMCMAVREPEGVRAQAEWTPVPNQPGSIFATAVRMFDAANNRAETLTRSREADGSVQPWDEYCVMALMDLARAEALGSLLTSIDPAGEWPQKVRGIQNGQRRLRNMVLTSLVFEEQQQQRPEVDH